MAGKKKVAKKKETKEKKKTQVATKPKSTKQQAELKAIITDPQGNVTEMTKPFGEDIVVMENMANVGYSYGETINLGNYSSAKFQVSLHVPCYMEEMNKYFPAAKKKVMAWSEAIKKEIEKEI